MLCALKTGRCWLLAADVKSHAIIIIAENWTEKRSRIQARGNHAQSCLRIVCNTMTVRSVSPKRWPLFFPCRHFVHFREFNISLAGRHIAQSVKQSTETQWNSEDCTNQTWPQGNRHHVFFVPYFSRMWSLFGLSDSIPPAGRILPIHSSPYRYVRISGDAMAIKIAGQQKARANNI